MTLTVSPSGASPANAQAAAGSSFYAGMKVLPKAERDAMYAVYGFCRIVDDIADDQSLPAAVQRTALDTWRHDVRSLYAGGDPGRAAMLAAPIARYDLAEADFQAVIDGMQMDLDGLSRPDLATMQLYCDRVAVAVGRLSVKIFGMDPEPGEALAHHLGRALQLTNILRDIDEDAAMGRLYLPDELLREAAITSHDPGTAVAEPGVDQVCRQLAATAQAHFESASAILAAKPRGLLAAPRLMASAYASLLARMRRRGWAPPRTRVRVNKFALILGLLREGLSR